MHGQSRRVLSIAFLIGFLPALLHASEGPPPVLNPRTCASPSGEYQLLVDPSTMHGQGDGSYRLTRRGAIVWEATHPFTLWEAEVSDDGVVVGYAYSHGWRGFPPENAREKTKRSDWNGAFHVVIFAPDGKLRLNEVTKREPSRFMHSPPTPLADGMFLDGGNDRLVIRFSDPDLNARVNTWRAYRLSDGKRVGEFKPREHLRGVPRFCDDFKARPVRGTPLTLVHWWLFDEKPGAKFTLVDAQGRPVWTLDLPGDYAIPGDQQAEWRLRDQIQQHGAILRCDEEGRFDLWHVGSKQQVSYKVRPNQGTNGEWEVSEISRATYVPPQKAAAEYEEIRFDPLGKLSLQARDAAKSPIRDVSQFDFDSAGNIGFVRRDEGDTATFVLVRQDGKVAAEIGVSRGEPNRSDFMTAWLDKQRWIVVGVGWGIDPVHRAWHVDTAAGKADEIASFACPTRIAQLAGDRRGGFVARVEGEFEQDGVLAFDGDGKQRWRAPRKHSGGDILMSPHGVAVSTEGNVGVVCSFNELMQVFDASGKHVRRIEFKNAFSREPVYPGELAADRDGGWIVGDWQGTPPYFRISRTGKLVGPISPRYSDGRTFPLHNGVQAAPDGRLWTTDGSALLRLRDDGVVDHIVGETPSADSLGEVAGMTVDARGSFYLVSRRTGAVHVFDRDGNFRHICETRPGDFTSNEFLAGVVVADDGEVFASGATDRRTLRFSAEGRRIGFASEAMVGLNEWRFKPGSRERWELNRDDLLLVGADGKTKRRIDRRADRMWLEHVHGIAVAPDGGVVVGSYDSETHGFADPAVNVYDAQGDRVCTAPIESESYITGMAFDGKRVIVGRKADWLVIDVASRAIRRFAPDLPRDRSACWEPFFSPDRSELWLVEPNRRTVQRYSAAGPK